MKLIFQPLLFCLLLLFCGTLSLQAQNRDLHAERIVVDDNGTDGTLNRMTIQTPGTGLSQNVTLTVPDPGVTNAFFVLSTTPTFASHTINATLTGDGSVGTPYGINLANPNTWTATQTFNGANILLTNSTNSAGQVQFAEPSGAGTDITTFEAGMQAANINYILPLSTTSTSTVEEGLLQLDAATGQLSWLDPSAVGGGWKLTGNALTTPGTNFLGTTDVQALHIYVNGGSSNGLILNTNWSIQRDTGGDVRGVYAVDFQRDRLASTEVASGSYATIGGGLSNTASANSATIAGGGNNNASNFAATIAGGFSNIASGQYAAIGGGRANTASGQHATVGGGSQNSSALFATVGGGGNNTASEPNTTIGGGRTNTASGQYATVGGGRENTASEQYATVGGGFGNTAAGYSTAIPGGRGLTLSGLESFGFLGANFDGLHNMTITASDVAVFGNTDLWLANNNNDASQLRLYEANTTTGDFPSATTHYSSFEAGNQTANISYTLPTQAPTLNGQLLSATTGGVMSWTSGIQYTTADGLVISTTTIAGSGTIGAGDVVVLVSDNNNAAVTPVVTLPAGTDGKILYVSSDDPDGATINDGGGTVFTLADDTEMVVLLFVGGSWRPIP